MKFLAFFRRCSEFHPVFLRIYVCGQESVVDFVADAMQSRGVIGVGDASHSCCDGGKMVDRGAESKPQAIDWAVYAAF
jgi:hypothetical protein